MSDTAITVEGVIDAFLVLLIGVGPKWALVPYVEITSSLDAATKRRVQRRMMGTAATVALILLVLGELLRALLHFSVGALSIAGGVILFILAVRMVLGQPDDSGGRPAPARAVSACRSVPAQSGGHRRTGDDLRPSQVAQCFRRSDRHPRSRPAHRRGGVPVGVSGQCQA